MGMFGDSGSRHSLCLSSVGYYIMATEYLLPEGGFYNDTAQGKEILLPVGGFINEQPAAAEEAAATRRRIRRGFWR